MRNIIPTEQDTTTSYWLDNQDRIIEVSSTWDVFAKENNGESVFSENIIGKSLKNYIKSDETRMFTELLLNKARLLNITVERQYRCDSPDVKRFMKMLIIPEEYNVLRVNHYVLKIEPHSIKLNFMYANDQKIKFMKRCSICNKVHFENKWLEGDSNEVSKYIRENNLIHVLYTVCEVCISDMGSAVVNF